MKIQTIKAVLQEKQKEMERHLRRSENQQKEMRKEKHLGHALDILEGLSHQIGYMNGAIEQTKQFLEMLNITDKEYLKRRRATEENMREIREQLRTVLKRARKEKTSGK